MNNLVGASKLNETWRGTGFVERLYGCGGSEFDGIERALVGGTGYVSLARQSGMLKDLLWNSESSHSIQRDIEFVRGPCASYVEHHKIVIQET